ncbi:MAG: alpha/beta hydrolase, partial [Algoriphagus sp.]
MPLLENSIYTRPKWLFNGHLETIYPSLFRKVSVQPPVQERISTHDGDFLDLDWYRQNTSKLVIISHGLEGNSTRAYMLGMVKTFLAEGYDVLTWNFRSCSEEMNKQVIFYHSGATYDLDQIVSHAYDQYEEISLVGFSLGGNLTLKYLGEKGDTISKIRKGVAISVPLHLASSSKKISETANTLYS